MPTELRDQILELVFLPPTNPDTSDQNIGRILILDIEKNFREPRIRHEDIRGLNDHKSNISFITLTPWCSQCLPLLLVCSSVETDPESILERLDPAVTPLL